MKKLPEDLSFIGGLGSSEALSLAQITDGNLAHAIRMSRDGGEQPDLERFVDWMRACWSRDGKAFVNGSESFASLGREGQKRFLHYATHL